MKYLNSYKVYEEMNKGGINIDLMQDLYDICLDHFDNGMSLTVFVKGTAFGYRENGKIRRFFYDHNNPIDIDALKEDEWYSIYNYHIVITDEFGPVGRLIDITKEVVERLRGMYPNENINIKK